MNRLPIAILDFGSQVTQLIARRTREIGIYSEIVAPDIRADELKSRGVQALILSGSPYSVYDRDAPMPDGGILNLGVPVLGICYGQQAMALLLGGKVEGRHKAEYGPASVVFCDESPLLEDLISPMSVWMSHGDRITEVPPGFRVLGTSAGAPVAIMADEERLFYGVQFHPEVIHTEGGTILLANFFLNIAGIKPDWNMHNFIQDAVTQVQSQVPDGEEVMCALSGGVDSSVLAYLLARALPGRVRCVFVDNGLLRKNEAQEVCATFAAHEGIEFHCVDASQMFIHNLIGTIDPEEKRRIIGHTFIRVFEEQLKQWEKVKWLAQGTLYPDVIESQSVKGPSATIKTHHNVGGLPAEMKLKLLEPLRGLFKDEVRQLGRELGLPEKTIKRHPFPGPGLAVRCLGEVNADKLALLREADSIAIEELYRSGYYDAVAQALVVLLPVRSVGVMGDGRTYAFSVVFRAVTTEDFMTANCARLPYELLERITSRIVGEVKGINRVLYDLTTKPPATIEWE